MVPARIDVMTKWEQMNEDAAEMGMTFAQAWQAFSEHRLPNTPAGIRFYHEAWRTIGG
jgi:hypothetical protein